MRWLGAGLVLLGLGLAGWTFWPLGLALAIGMWALWKTS